MNVEWREIPGYDQKYLVSSDGRVMNAKTGRVLRPSRDHHGYLTISLSHHSTKLTQKIHRLVALAFVENHENKPCIDHIDRNRINNHKDNLRWTTLLENNLNREPRELPLNIFRHLAGYQVRLRRNNVLYYTYCKSLEEAIAWKEATLNAIQTNLIQ